MATKKKYPPMGKYMDAPMMVCTLRSSKKCHVCRNEIKKRDRVYRPMLDGGSVIRNVRLHADCMMKVGKDFLGEKDV